MVRLAELIAEKNEREGLSGRPLTQAQIARDLGTSEALVSRHSSGQARMSYDSARRYADYFGVRVAEVDDRFSDAA